MKEIALIAPIVLVLAGFAGALSLLLPNRFRTLYAIAVFSIAQTFVFTTVVSGFIHTVLKGEEPLVYMYGGWPPPLGVVYIADSLSFSLALLIILVVTVGVIVSWTSIESSERKILFQTFALVLEAGLLGALFAADFFHLFVTWEVVSIASVGLAIVGSSDRGVARAILKYALSSTLVTTLYMFVVVLTVYGSYGTLSFPDYIYKLKYSQGMSGLSGGVFGNTELATGLLMMSVAIAFGLSAGLFPLHFWMPDLYERISPPTAMLLAGGKEVVAVYVVIRNFYTLHFEQLGSEEIFVVLRGTLFVLGVAGIIYGALSILAEKSFGRMLAYYLIMDAGIMFAVLSVGELEVIEAFLYLAISHAVLTIALFSLRGLLEREKRSYVVISGAMAAAGVPPFSSFFSKLLALLALVDKPLALFLFMPSVAISSVASLLAILRVSSRSLSENNGCSKTYVALFALGIALSLFLGLGTLWLKSFVLESVAIKSIDPWAYVEPVAREAIGIYERYWPRG
ncbi:MAG: proton-conducting transporter membrane subunit [Acidilobaceae archaeon]